jgi:hypothetical protein
MSTFKDELVLTADEKGGRESPDSSTSGDPVSWAEEEERRLVRRLDRIVMPLLMLAFFALQLDRGNMYALLHMHRDDCL